MSRLQKHSVLGKADISFRERALAEAARYGSDSWVFLRELLQNARDAGARRIELSVAEEGDVESISCRDDGCGMSAVHAHRYLFALYASSKEGDARQAGQFGVGFWSVLRFLPDRVVIRSRPRGGDAWQVELNHRLENAVFTSWEMTEGTEIILERRRPRPAAASDSRRPLAARPLQRPLADKVFDAVWRYGRFLTRCRDRPERARRDESPILLTVNGRPVHAALELPAPSSAFRRRGFRGVVGLGSEPRVELFANGLFVRHASCLEDLLERTPASELEGGGSSLDLPGSLAPQILLDSARLEPLLARSDVRQTRHLRRLVTTAERELERLIERQLEAVRPVPFFLTFWARLRDFANRLRGSRQMRMAWWLAPMALAGVIAGWWTADWAVELPAARWRPPQADPVWWDGLDFDPRFGWDSGGYVSDLGPRYRGPWVDPPLAPGEPPSLSYQPADEDVFLSALIVERPETWSSADVKTLEAAGPYEGPRCPDSGRGCFALRLQALGGDMRLPVPAGHRVDPSSVRRNGRPLELLATASGEPLVRGVEHRDLLEYRTAPAEEPAPQRPVPAGSVPRVLVNVASTISSLPLRERVSKAVDEIRRLIAYDRSRETIRQYLAAQEKDLGFAEAALSVGKGDCDVQNGVLVLLLRESGVAARLAVGFVGQKGKAVPSLHAWAEYLGEDRRWRVADVSAGQASAEPLGLLWVKTPRPHLRGASFGNPAPLATNGGTSPEPGTVSAVLAYFDGRTNLGLIGRSIALGAVLVFSAAVLIRRRSSSARLASVRLAEPDLAALLGGALQHSGLARLPALAYGRFIPLIGASSSAGRGRRDAISLHEARRRAAAGRLFSSAVGSRLARVAAAKGLPVIDAGRAEGRVAGLGLGAVDLDEWSDLLDCGTTSGLVRHLNAYLDSAGEDWRVALASPLSRPLKVVDLGLLGLGCRQVLIDPRAADFAATGPRLDLRSDAAAFRLLDAIIDHLDLTRPDRARLLAELARRAVVEKYGR